MSDAALDPDYVANLRRYHKTVEIEANQTVRKSLDFAPE